MAEPVETNPCPGCGAKLAVEPQDLGKEVECPYCNTSFRAVRAGGSGPVPLPPPAPPKLSSLEDVDETGKPVRKRERDRDEDEDDERPSRRRNKDEQDGPVSSRRRRRDDDEIDDDDDGDTDDYDDDRPRVRRRRSYQEPHRGGTILFLGILGCLCCQIVGIVALIMGAVDLGKMGRGQMDPTGKSTTIIGMVFGGIGIGLSVFWIVVNIFMR